MRINIKEILLENAELPDYYFTAKDSIDTYNKSAHAYADLHNRGISDEERVALIKGMNNIRGNTNLPESPNNIENIDKPKYQADKIINDYDQYSKDEIFKDTVIGRVKDAQLAQLNNASLQNSINAKEELLQSKDRLNKLLKNSNNELSNSLHDSQRINAIGTIGLNAAGIGGLSYIIHNELKKRRPQN